MPPQIEISFNENISHSVGDVRLSREIALLDMLAQFGVESKAESFAVTVFFRNISPFLQSIPGFFSQVDQQNALGLREFLDLNLSVSSPEQPGAASSASRKTSRRSRGDGASRASTSETQPGNFSDDPEAYRQTPDRR